MVLEAGSCHPLEMEMESGVPIKIKDADLIIDAKIAEEVKRELGR